jgi:hypothetical protein
MRKVSRASKLMVFAVVFGVMAFGATAAHALPGSHWNISGKETTVALKAQIDASLENNHGILLTKVGLTTVEILCTTIKFVNAFLSTTGSATGKIHFEGCVFKGNGSVLPPCKPHSPGALEGLIETNTLKALIVLHTPSGGTAEPVVELVPAAGAGTPFVTIVNGKEVGSECAILTKADITGTQFLKDCQKEGTVEKVTHLVEEEKTLSKLLYGGNKATLDGSATVFLTGAHVGMKFSGIPG